MKVWEIIRIIEESPIKAIDGDDITTIFETPDGHRFSVFFDCGDPDYVNWIKPNDADRIDLFSVLSQQRNRATEALAYLASNLIHLPHVDKRLQDAQFWFLEGHNY